MKAATHTHTHTITEYVEGAEWVHLNTRCVQVYMSPAGTLVKLLTFHVEVAVEVRRPAAIQHVHSAVGHLLICVHIAIVVLVAVNELEHKRHGVRDVYTSNKCSTYLDVTQLSRKLKESIFLNSEVGTQIFNSST